jgi:hypothetical protein
MTTTTITTLLALPPDLVERDRVRRQALRVGAVRHEGLAPLREVVFAGEGLALTWEVPVTSEDLVADASALSALAPVAAGLALLHDGGLAHGGVSEANVHLRAGRGVLSGWRPGGTPEGDVAALVALIDSFLPSASVGAEIAQILIAGSDPDPAARPSMARIAAALDRAAVWPGGAAEPHLAGYTAPPISPPAHRRARVVHEDEASTSSLRALASSGPKVATGPMVHPRGRGRHAASQGPRAATALSIRLPWRWGVALAGVTAAAFLGMSALGSAGSAQEICPAVSAKPGGPAEPPLSGSSAWSSLVQQAVGD